MNTRIISLTTYTAIVTALVDQLSKRLASSVLAGFVHPLSVLDFINIGLTKDHGFSFIFGGYDFSWIATLCFTVIGLTVFFAFSRWRLHTTSKIVAFGSGLVMGGIVGNLIDRIRFDGTLDIFNFVFWGHAWPSFNLADLAMMFGVFLLVLDIFIGERRPDRYLPF